MDFLTGTGILRPIRSTVVQRRPDLFIADEGKAAQQGFGSAEPYLYENEITDWVKPVKYEYINDVGWKNYAESIATEAGEHHEYADCFTALVPIIQQATLDYLDDPARQRRSSSTPSGVRRGLRLGLRPGTRLRGRDHQG